MKIEIKHQFSGKVLFEHEQENNTNRITLEAAVSARANLAGADLDGANLARAYLAGANLAGATYGEGVEVGNNPLFILGLTWPVYIFKTHIKIGCRLYSKKEWIDFADSDIAKMESRASEFWKKWKKHILWMAMEES